MLISSIVNAHSEHSTIEFYTNTSNHFYFNLVQSDYKSILDYLYALHNIKSFYDINFKNIRLTIVN